MYKVQARKRKTTAPEKPVVILPSRNNKPLLKVIPLGGLHEIGKNTCVYEYEDEIILVDAGIGFPTDGMHGINVVLPDMTYLKENQQKIKAMIVTHGHEDHVGGIPYHLKQIDTPIIYGPRLAMALLRDKLEESGLHERTIIKTVSPREVVKIGKHFKVEFIRNTHSIADSFTLAIHTPIGVLIHTGDYKIDHTPVDGEYFDLHRLAQLGEEGILCLLGDSTNSEVPGFTPSERAVYPGLEKVFNQASGRLMVTTFSTSVHRVNMLLELAMEYNRKVGVVGRSMLNVIAHARNLGYIKVPDNLFVPLRNLSGLPENEVLILCTGSQGEKFAAMTRISKGEHRQVKIRQGDTIIFSASPIPGNTIAVVNTIDRLMMQGANVVYGKQAGVHVSGHGCQEDQKLMLSLAKPKFFVPVHGEHRMLVQHSKTAQSVGIPPENIVIIQNGDTIELTADSIGKGNKVPSGIQLVDTAGVVHDSVMEERQQLAEDGVITIAASIDNQGRLLSQPQINLRGVVCQIEIASLERMIIRTIDKTITDRVKSSLLLNGHDDVNWTSIRIDVETNLGRLIQRELNSEPLVIFMLQLQENTPKTMGDNGNGNITEVMTPKEEEEIDSKFTRRRRKTTVSV
ncbi:MAG: ribonuclease J [Cyanobacteria bacterium]|nr:ribonuclease J [Cyanobacteria bacterium CG_2015-22_32_23]NCQ03915.1 ribonuclease J [Cyanobacteria bacterium CG_2015-09_32_10]NCQ41797.1 ribonuclease J [Cyanobacteria bacterium CG_2015-04_32_10]NCS85375.1 ribonuclease J [Cyanobacteria bacterium CG_2015-02_32_10]